MIRYPQLYSGIVRKGVLICQCDMSLSQLSYESLFLSLDIVFLCGGSNDMRSWRWVPLGGFCQVISSSSCSLPLGPVSMFTSLVGVGST